MNRAIKEVTVKRCHYERHDQLRQHIGDFVAVFNLGRRLKALQDLTRDLHLGRDQGEGRHHTGQVQVLLAERGTPVGIGTL